MSNFVKLTFDTLNVGEAVDTVNDASTGAVSIFVGTTRDHFDGKSVVKLEYEAYKSMAEKKILEICEDIRSKWTLHNVAIWHRLGTVNPKEASVVIAITSEHRKDSLEAVQFAIDSLKATVPIWKKEVYDDGAEWKVNAECGWKDAEKQKVKKIDPSLIQITATEEEIEARIDAFIARKRSEIDASNVQEFCSRLASDDSSEFSCARTDSIVVRRTGTSSHLRKSNTVNVCGPQTKEPNIQIKTEQGIKKEKQDLPTGLCERLNHLEAHVFGANLPVPKDVYTRLKALEERVLFLEGVSPEYFSVAQMLSKTSQCDEADAAQSKESDAEVMASLSSINKQIQDLRSNLLSKTEIKMEI